MKDYNVCKGCIGECPDNCECCVYGKCKKLVDYALVSYKWQEYLIAIDTPREYIEEKRFYEWYKQYFRLSD